MGHLRRKVRRVPVAGGTAAGSGLAGQVGVDGGDNVLLGRAGAAEGAGLPTVTEPHAVPAQHRRRAGAATRHLPQVPVRRHTHAAPLRALATTRSIGLAGSRC